MTDILQERTQHGKVRTFLRGDSIDEIKNVDIRDRTSSIPGARTGTTCAHNPPHTLLCCRERSSLVSH